MIKNLKVLITLVLISTIVNTASQNIDEQISCTSKTTCSACIQTQRCAWCMKPDFTDKPRCFQPDLHSISSCPEEYIFNPDNEETMVKNLKLGGGFQSFGQSKPAQISPQHVNLKLRINEKHTMKVSYAQAADYPVDLYYLMDLSKSMEDDKMKLSHLGDLLSDTMRKITTDFRLGFGSFVDKVLMPYVSTVPKNLISPCNECEAPYGYHNVMSLTSDTRSFSDHVRNAHVSGNLDAPEGGLDAIMQALVCKDVIGWRQNARRVLVFSTDAGFHFAGDGKLAGLITPNDGECHMLNNVYTHSTFQDYPSISHINLKAKENGINIIFAVTGPQQKVYEELSKHIEGSSSAVISEDSSNIVELVRDEYNKITSSVEMKDSADGPVKVSYWSKCLGESKMQTNKCDGLKFGDMVEFETEIVITSCPADPKDRKQSFKISPVGVGEELTVDLEIICSCDCESEGPNFEINSPACNGNGIHKCGQCECYDGFFGQSCECNNKDIDSEFYEFQCRPDNHTDIECSGRGNCVCGYCNCNKRDNPEELIDGLFCECDNFSCDRNKGLICSGPDQGFCECGKCVCKDGWGGPDCGCSTSIDACKAPNGEICSGHGTCICGYCQCEINENVRYSGKYCEECPTC